MLRSLSRAGQVTRAEWLDLAQAQLALLLAQVEVWFRPRGRLLASAPAVTAPLTVASRRRAERLSWAVTRAASHGLFRPGCLPRSVALHRLLRRAGVSGSQIRIGVRAEPRGMGAHAWVTLHGTVIGDDPVFVGHFTPIVETTPVNTL